MEKEGKRERDRREDSRQFNETFLPPSSPPPASRFCVNFTNSYSVIAHSQIQPRDGCPHAYAERDSITTLSLAPERACPLL